jgi:hypothetical protein
MIFLIQYDRTSGFLVALEPFDDRGIASDARLQLEVRLHREGTPHEVVLLEAESEADLKKTHARYFKKAKQLGNADQVKRAT